MTTTDLSPLFNSSQTFSATSIQLSTIPSTDQFHLLFRLVDFLNSPETADPSTSHNYEDWMTARMKAEWCLWEGYSKWDIGLNPFLGHFVEIWEQRYTQEHVTADILVVGIILSGQAKEVNHRVKITVVGEYNTETAFTESACVGGIRRVDIDTYFTIGVIATAVCA
jgi:hypothetical protein